MKNKNYSIGRGIAIFGKWLSIALIVTILYTSTLNFIDERLNPDKCYYERPPYPEPYLEPTIYPEEKITQEVEVNKTS